MQRVVLALAVPATLCLAAVAGSVSHGSHGAGVGAPPASLGLDPFYEKHLDLHGLPIVASGRVRDEALVEAAALLERMLALRPDIRETLVEQGVRFAVIAESEVTTDIPEYSDLEPPDYWDRRARGLGPTRRRPVCSAGEENILGYANDRYRGESILIHEFAHAMHEMGVAVIDEDFDARLRAAYDEAMREGLWADTYAATNHKEYWAEGVQSWFDANLTADPPNGVHGPIDTRDELRAYDPRLAALIAEVYADDAWRWSPPGDKVEGDEETRALDLAPVADPPGHRFAMPRPPRRARRAGGQAAAEGPRATANAVSVGWRWRFR